VGKKKIFILILTTLVLNLFLVEVVYTQKPVASPKKNVISSSVGQVGNNVVTSREVLISYILDQQSLLGVNSKKHEQKNWLIKKESPEFNEHLSRVMLEYLVKLEAESFSVGQVSAEETKLAAQSYKEAFKQWQEWRDLEVSDSELELIIVRKKTAQNFLKFKTESSGVIISDEEAKAYYDKNRVKFSNAPFPQFKESIKEVLSRQQMEEKLKDWFETLKRKYRLKFISAEVDQNAPSAAPRK
jgi:hypothetical protein